ncbi:hypothetical protein ACFQ88_34655 [Paenibacillus sp. NPDC056579]|uniref:hypothetical protein n=1 Tax=unclassified Paenibacillus TaxID=185978 RepID=UPI001EF7594D|nr:hypothetical protein [Paenibacillus sp. H1-7]ULL18974.1 hypothetical protein DVH26_33795 [Paenibacillus sp. H1-7]
MSYLYIPKGNQKLTVELTVKEAMAISSGVHFRENPRLAAEARKKVREQMDSLLMPQSIQLQYHLLEV